MICLRKISLFLLLFFLSTKYASSEQFLNCKRIGGNFPKTLEHIAPKTLPIIKYRFEKSILRDGLYYNFKWGTSSKGCLSLKANEKDIKNNFFIATASIYSSCMNGRGPTGGGDKWYGYFKYECGEKPNIFKKIFNPTLASYNDSSICFHATTFKGKSKVWNTNKENFVKEAKFRNLTCEMEKKSLVSGTDDYICEIATYIKDNVIMFMPSHFAAVQEAKSRGLDCGVEQNKIDLVLRANGNSWVEIEDKKGNFVFRKLMKAGEEYKIPNNKQLFLNTGNAGVLSLHQGNKEISSLGKIGEVFTSKLLTFSSFDNNKMVNVSKPKNINLRQAKPTISSSELEQEKQKRLALQRKAEEKEQKLLEEARKRKALEQRIAELEKKNKELSKAKKKDADKPKGGSGSGFFVSKLGHIITNQHVVNQCSKITVGDSIDKQVPAQLLETDKRNDLALLRTTTLKMASAETKTLIQKLSIHIVPLATGGLMRGNDIELGEDVLVAGFPYGDIFSKNIKVTKGIVSSTTGVGDDSGQFQLDAAVQPGNSGGPIYDKYGNIVGVVVAQLNKFKMAKTIGSLPENVNFGIKASTVKQFLNTSGLPTKWSERSEPMSNQELSKIASKQTVMVVCHRD